MIPTNKYLIPTNKIVFPTYYLFIYVGNLSMAMYNGIVFVSNLMMATDRK